MMEREKLAEMLRLDDNPRLYPQVELANVGPLREHLLHLLRRVLGFCDVEILGNMLSFVFCPLVYGGTKTPDVDETKSVFSADWVADARRGSAGSNPAYLNTRLIHS